MIVLSDPLSDFAGAEADHRIGAGVVVGIASEDLNAQSALFQVSGVAAKSRGHHVLQHRRIPLASPKMIAGQDRVQLFHHQFAVFL